MRNQYSNKYFLITGSDFKNVYNYVKNLEIYFRMLSLYSLVPCHKKKIIVIKNGHLNFLLQVFMIVGRQSIKTITTFKHFCLTFK